jgi:hypothetical protein
LERQPNKSNKVEKSIMSPLSKIALRRINYRKRAKAILESLDQETSDVYESYRALYQLWCSNNAAVPELRPLFRIPGVVADSTFSVNEEFRQTVRALAREIRPLLSDQKESA